MSPIHDLLSDLQRRGVTLWHEGDSLHYRAAKGVLTPEVVHQLRHRKVEIIEFLGAATRAARPGRLEDAAEMPRTAGPAPLSFAQERLWFLHQFGGEHGGPGAAYNVPTALSLTGALDVQALARSLEEVVRRHAVLRTRVVTGGDAARQIAEPSSALPLPLIDLAGMAPAAREAEVQRRMAAAADHVFDLASGPFFRFELVRLDARHHIFLSVLHHFVTDGWSMWVLFRELSALYAAFSRGDESPLAELSHQYADYAAHERATAGEAAFETELRYWRTQLHGAPPVIELPVDRPRPAVQRYHGGMVRLALDAALTRGLKRLAQQADASLFMVLAAGYATLLHRYCGQDEVVIGTPVANRHRREVEEMIGAFSTYLPLRVDLSGEPSFAALLGRIRQTTFDALSHQQVPFEQIVDAARPERMLGVPPIFQVALVLQNLPSAPLVLEGLDVVQLPIERHSAKLDLSLLVEESGDGMHAELEYNADLFERRTIDRMATRLQRILAQAIETPGMPIGRIRLDPAGECATPAPVARPVVPIAITDAFRAQVARTPERIALSSAAEQVTYAQLRARANQLARHLAALGVGPESRVGVCLPRSNELIVSLLAVLKAGAAYVPLDASHPADRHATILQDAGASIVITSELLHRDRDAIAARDTTPLPRRVDASQLAYVIYTSGSTGRPKGVMVEHRAVTSLVQALHEAVFSRYKTPLQVALVASTVFDASVQQIFASLLLGHTLHVVPDDVKRDGERLTTFFGERGIELADCTPSLLGVMLDAGLGRDAHLTLRHLLVGGEALPAALAQRLHAQDRARRVTITNVYGPTECGVDDTAYTVEPGATVSAAGVPIGGPLANARVHVLDASREPAPTGIAGDIWIGGACLGRGYLGQPDATALAYQPDPFVAGERLYFTGDRGRWTEDGTIAFLGRSDLQIKIRGYRIEPAEIEAALGRCADVKEAIVLLDRAGGDPRLVACVVPGPGRPTTAALRDQLSEQLPAYMIPAVFRTIDRIPLNASGKVDRARLLADADAVELARGVEYVAPSSAHEQVLAAAWQSVLARERIGAEDHFFSLGGDSIKALQMVARVRQAGFKLDVRDVFVHPTLGQLASRLTPVSSAAVADAPGPDAPLAPVQSWFVHEYPGNTHHYLQSLLLAADSAVDAGALQRNLQAIQSRHAVLRSRFVMSEGRWVQRTLAPTEPVAFEIVDLTASDDPSAALAAHAARVQASLHITDGPVFRAVLYKGASDQARCYLLLAAHHLVVDAVSWRIILEDLGQHGSVSATDPYSRWTRAMQAYAETAAGEEQAYWRAIDETEVAPLVVDDPDAAGCYRDRVEHRLSLSAGDTLALLTGAHAAYNTRADDLLLTALGRALDRWSGASRHRILLESHGRVAPGTDVDVSRTVGWFTARYPVRLDAPRAGEIGRQIKATKEMLRAVPHGGAGYEALRDAAASPQIAFNYLGQIGGDLRSGAWTWVEDDIGPAIDPAAPLLFEIEIVGLVVDDRLQFRLGYSGLRFRPETIARLATALADELVAVIAHACDPHVRELTPSDIDVDGFSQDALDEFIRNL